MGTPNFPRNILDLQSRVKTMWPSVQQQFPAFEEPIIFSAGAISKTAPMYMRRYIDDDPNAFYMFLKADVSKGDASREAAKQMFDELFYNRLHLMSSYDINAGGAYSRDQAVDKEILPAKNDEEYKTYFEEVMDDFRRMQQEQAADERMAKLGFDINDGKTIDMEEIVDPDEPATGALRFVPKRDATGRIADTTAVGQAASTAVGELRPIWYAVDIHCAAAAGHLGYTRGDQLLGRGRNDQTQRRHLREKDSLDESLSYEQIDWINRLTNC